MGRCQVFVFLIIIAQHLNDGAYGDETPRRGGAALLARHLVCAECSGC